MPRSRASRSGPAPLAHLAPAGCLAVVLGLLLLLAPSSFAQPAASIPDSARTAAVPDSPRGERAPVRAPETSDDLAPGAPAASLAGASWPDLVLDQDRAVVGLPIEHLYRGQKGYGLSVFAGTEPVPFEVEVLGTWQNNTPGMTYLLSRLSGQDLERSGVLAGMSGSPVYFDGKLVGAVAFSFSFGMDPIAGITPIGAMRGLGNLVLEAPPGMAPASAAAAGTIPTGPIRAPAALLRAVPDLEQLTTGQLDSGLLDTFLDLLAPARTSADGRPATTWTAAGFDGPAREKLAARLGPLLPAASGRASSVRAGASLGRTGASPSPRSTPEQPGKPGHSELAEHPAIAESDLQAGDAVALVLARGDISLAAHGTVTERRGDSIVAFGHPIYSLGPLRVPMAESEVITPVPSVSSSFKLSNVGELIGVFDEDREAGAHGLLGEVPRMTPVHVRLRGVQERDFHMQLADLPMFRPTLLAMSAMGSISSGTWASGPQSFEVHARFRLEGHDDIVVERAFDGLQAANDMLIHLLGIAAFLELNDLGPVPIRGFELDLYQSAEPRMATLLDVRADRSEVSPGEQLDLRLTLQPHHGEVEYRNVSIEVPRGLADGRYYLMVGDGASMDAARLAVNRPRDLSLDDKIDALRALSDNRELHVMGLVAARGRSLPGSVLPGLPPSMRSVLGDAGEALELRITETRKLPWDRPLDGLHRVDLVISSSALAAAGTAAAGTAAAGTAATGWPVADLATAGAAPSPSP